MRAFNPIQRSNVAPVDIDTFGNTYRELEQGHQRAVQFASALNTELAKLDLNEAEDAWRQQKINSVRATLSDNTKYGNAAGAVDDLVRAQGDIFSDPGLIGRIRAQKDYKDYINNLNNRNDLSEDYKNYYRARTKYKYNDILDENGKIVGGTKWEPDERPVSQIDFYKIMDAAAKNASAETFGGDRVQFMDVATGKVSNNYTPGAAWVHVNTMTQQVTKLTAEKIQAAIDAYIKANPEVKASLEQDYKIDKWKYDQNPTIFTDAIDAKGNIKTFNDYIQSKIDPFIEGKKYNNYVSSTKYNDAALNMLAKAYATGSGKKDNIVEAATGTPTVVSGKYRVSGVPTFRGLQNERIASVAVSNKLKEKYPENTIEFNNKTTESDVLNYIKQHNVGNEEMFDILDAFKNYRNMTLASRLTYANIDDAIGSDLNKAAYQFKNQLNSGVIDPIQESDSPALKSFKKEFAEIRNGLIGDADGIGIYLKDNRALQNFTSQYGEDRLKADGVKIRNIDGRVAVILPADRTDGIIDFINAGEYAHSTNRSFASMWNNAFGGKTGKMFRADSDGKDIGMAYLTIGGTTPLSDVSSISTATNAFVRKLNNFVDEIPQFEEKITDVTRKGSGSANQMRLEYLHQASTDTKEKNMLRADIKMDKEKWANEFAHNYNLPFSSDLMVVDEETGEYRAANSDDRKFYQDCQTGKNAEKAFTGFVDRIPEIGWRPAFAVKDAKGNSKTFVLVNGFADPFFKQLNESIPEVATQLIERLDGRFEAFQTIGIDGPIAVVKDFNTGSYNIFNANEELIAKNIDENTLRKTAEWAAAYNRFADGTYTPEMATDIQRTYMNFLESMGLSDEEIAAIFSNVFAK